MKRNIVHIGHFKAGEAINTVPSNGYLEGTIRTYDIDDLTIVKNQMQKIAESVKLLFNVDCEVKFAEGYPLQSIVEITYSNRGRLNKS